MVLKSGVYSHKGILLSNKKQANKTYDNMNGVMKVRFKSSYTAWFHISSFFEQARAIYSVREQSRGCLWGHGDWEEWGTQELTGVMEMFSISWLGSWLRECIYLSKHILYISHLGHSLYIHFISINI